jgi:hypothetical protein
MRFLLRRNDGDIINLFPIFDFISLIFDLSRKAFVFTFIFMC